MGNWKFAAAALAALCAPMSEAHASVTMYFGAYLPGSHLTTFDTIPLGTTSGTFNLTGYNGTVNLNSNSHIVQGNVSGQYANPYLDNTRYVSINTSGNVIFTLNQPAHYFGLQWGSVDTYNDLSFYNGNTLISVIHGAQVISAANLIAGNQGAFGTVYANFTSPLLQPITKVVASSSGIAFEFDNVRVSNVPLPASAWMFLSALAAGFTFSRRKRLAA